MVRKFDLQSVRPCVVQNHIKSKKQEESKERLKKRSPGKGTLHKQSKLMMLRRIERVRHCLKNTMSYRAKVVIAFIKSGIL